MIPASELANPTGARFYVLAPDGRVKIQGGFRAGMTEAEILAVLPYTLAPHGLAVADVQWGPAPLTGPAPMPPPNVNAPVIVAPPVVPAPTPVTPAPIPVAAPLAPIGVSPMPETITPTPAPASAPQTNAPTSPLPGADLFAQARGWFDGSTQIFDYTVPNKYLALAAAFAGIWLLGSGRSKRWY